MALRAVGKFLSQSAVPRLTVVRTLSANAGPRKRIWNCSKETEGEVRLDCLKDMLVDGDIQLFDVREPHELASSGRIPKSTNIPCKFQARYLFFPVLLNRQPVISPWFLQQPPLFGSFSAIQIQYSSFYKPFNHIFFQTDAIGSSRVTNPKQINIPRNYQNFHLKIYQKMKEAWGNHLLENISIKVSDGYYIRNLKRPPFWSTQIRGCLEVFMY